MLVKVEWLISEPGRSIVNVLYRVTVYKGIKLRTPFKEIFQTRKGFGLTAFAARLLKTVVRLTDQQPPPANASLQNLPS